MPPSIHLQYRITYSSTYMCTCTQRASWKMLWKLSHNTAKAMVHEGSLSGCEHCWALYITHYSLWWHTVKRLYFAGCIFREFRELVSIRENCSQQKMCQHHMIRILRWFVHPVIALWKYFEICLKSDCMPSEDILSFLQSVVFKKTHDRIV